MTCSSAVKSRVTWDIAFSQIRHVKLWKIRDSDMRHCHFLNLTCDIGDPHQGPPECRSGTGLSGNRAGQTPTLLGLYSQTWGSDPVCRHGSKRIPKVDRTVWRIPLWVRACGAYDEPGFVTDRIRLYSGPMFRIMPHSELIG